MPLIADAMAAGRAFDLPSPISQRIVVTVGPGAFTGIRIVAAAKRALALATGAEPRSASDARRLRRRRHEDAGRVVAVAAIDARTRRDLCPAALGGGPLVARALIRGGSRRPAFRVRSIVGPSPRKLAGSGADVLAGGRRRHQPDRASRRGPRPRGAARPLGGAARKRLPPKPLYLRAPDAQPQDAARVARQ